MEQSSSRNPRKSLTKRQLENPEALELLALLQSFAEDGRLVDDEVHELQEWLHRNVGSDLPAVDHLRSAVEEVLADGRVTEGERVWLQKAIETVLPRDEREYAAMRRREARAADREELRLQKQEERAIRERTKPIARFDFMVAGTRHEGRVAVIRGACKEGMAVTFAREYGNPHSRNALLVRLPDGRAIGYVPEADAARLAPMFDAGALHTAEIKKILQGSVAPVPVVWGVLYEVDAPVPNAVPVERTTASKSPSPPRASKGQPSGCGLAVVLLLTIVALGVLL
jgi:hypothetical protein